MWIFAIKISVIIPVYNRPVLLIRALRSVQSQTYPVHEVIVVDDGSDADLTADLQTQFPCVLLLKQSNLGVSRARNNGVSVATGEWVAFLDSDDEWLADKLQNQVKSLRASKLLVSHTNEIWVRGGIRVNSHNKHQKQGGDLFERSLALCLISPSSVLMDKTLLEELGGFDEQLPACEDYDLWLQITSTNLIDYIDKPLIIKYGGHDDQLSMKHWGMDRFRIYSMEKLLNQLSLTSQQRTQLLTELINKCTIFSKGALKHGNQGSYADYSHKISQYSTLLAAMS